MAKDEYDWAQWAYLCIKQPLLHQFFSQGALKESNLEKNLSLKLLKF